MNTKRSHFRIKIKVIKQGPNTLFFTIDKSYMLLVNVRLYQRAVKRANIQQALCLLCPVTDNGNFPCITIINYNGIILPDE